MMKVILHVTFTTCMSINMSCYGTLSTYISTFKGFRKHTIYLFQFCTYIWLHTYIIYILILEELTFWIQRIISKELVSIFARVHVCAVEHDITYIKNIFCLILSLLCFMDILINFCNLWLLVYWMTLTKSRKFKNNSYLPQTSKVIWNFNKNFVKNIWMTLIWFY